IRAKREGDFRAEQERRTQYSEDEDEFLFLPDDPPAQLPGPSVQTVSVSSSGVPRIRLEASRPSSVAAVHDSTAAAHLPTGHEQNLLKVARLSATLLIADNHEVSQKLVESLQEAATSEFNYVSPEIYLSLAEQEPSTAAQDAQVLFQQEQASKVATICASLPFVDDQTVYRGLLQQVREVSEANWNQVSPAAESTNPGGMTASQTSNKRRRQLDEEDVPMPQIAPGRRADGRLIVPAAVPAPKFPVHSAGPSSADPSSAGPSSAGPSSAGPSSAGPSSDFHFAGFSS
ncbi:hypothetical protein E4U38_001036, partial [Claviceps purpurea]